MSTARSVVYAASTFFDNTDGQYTGECSLLSTNGGAVTHTQRGIWISLEVPQPIIVSRLSFMVAPEFYGDRSFPAEYSVYGRSSNTSQWTLLFTEGSPQYAYCSSFSISGATSCQEAIGDQLIHDSGCFNNRFYFKQMAILVSRKRPDNTRNYFAFSQLRFYNYTVMQPTPPPIYIYIYIHIHIVHEFVYVESMRRLLVQSRKRIS
jgi:hypothetical protein